MAFADRRQTGHIGNPKRTLTSRSAGSVPERWTLANAAMKLTALGNNYYGDCVVAAWLHQAQAQAFYTYGVHYDPASLPAGLDQHGPRSFTVTGSGGAHVPLQSDISSWISQYSLGGEGDTIVTWWAANFPNIINTQWSPAYADAMRIYRNTPNYKIGPKEGRFNSDVASYISTNGIGTQGYHRIYADAISTTPDSVKQAIYFLGGAVMALNLPDSITKQRSWRLVSGADAKPGGFGSHDVYAIGYSPQALYVVSWGKVIPITWAFYSKYIEQVWGAASIDWVNSVTGQTPIGDTWAQLQARFNGQFTHVAQAS